MWESLWPGRDTPIGARHERRSPGDVARAGAGGGVCATSACDPRRHLHRAGWDAAQSLELDTLQRVRGVLRERFAARATLDPSLLTIGFARRFATYKRAGLVFSDLERLLTLPLQIVVAGKAHPQDAPGKELLQEIVELSRGPAAGRVVFIEGYDIDLARRAHSRLRRLAEHAAPSVRGLRDERDEGCRQRRPQPVRAGRLVGRGLRPRLRLGDRGRQRRGRRGGAVPACSPKRSSRALRRGTTGPR